MKKYKLTKNNNFKRLLCAGLATVILPSPLATKKYDESVNFNSTVNDNSVEYNIDEKDYKDANDVELSYLLNKMISDNTIYTDDMKNQEEYDESFLSFVDDINSVLIDFNEYKIKNAIAREKALLEGKDFSDDLKDINSYFWCNNGKINRSLLTYKLLYNYYKKNNNISFNALIIANAMSYAIVDDSNIIKKKNPGYDFRTAYKIIDNLVFKIDHNISDNMLGFYSLKYKNITLNPLILRDRNLMRRVLRHEIQHVFQDGLSNNEDYGIDDYYYTIEQPLKYNFMYERFAEYNAIEALGKKDFVGYANEDEKLKKVCISTGKDVNYFDSAIINHDLSKLTDCFEEECRHFSNSCLYELDIACGYGNKDSSEYKSNCYDAAMLKLYKNACVRLSKEYNKGNLSRNQYLNEINEVKNNIIGNCNGDYMYTNTRDSLEECVDQIEKMCNNYVKNKIK